MQVRIADEALYECTTFELVGVALEKVQKVYNFVVAEVMRYDYYVPGVGVGDFHETGSYGTVELNDRSYCISVDLELGIISISLANEPAGEDALDGMHEHWTSMRPDMWMDILPMAKKLLNL